MEEELGGPDTFHALAWHYDKELKKYEKAEEIYRLNIQHQGKNYKASIYNLAHMLRFRNREESITLLNMILDDVDALRLLGSIYSNNDKERSLFYYQEAIKQGDVKAMVELANAYNYGIFTTKETALGALEEGALGGNGTHTGPFQEAFRLYVQAAESGHVVAWMRVADCYQLGRGVAKNPEKEVECLLKVPHELLDSLHLYNLAMCYYGGQGVRRDKQKALELFYECDAKFNDKDAQYNIAMDFESLGNHDLALQWFKKAADQNDADALLKMMSEKYARDEDERQHYFMRYLFLRNRQPWTKIKDSRVDCTLVDTLYQEVMQLRKQVEEYELAPPIEGGRLFLQAQEQFRIDAIANDKGKGH
jgi:TPR repeat protein